jgi:hypothetical protein
MISTSIAALPITKMGRPRYKTHKPVISENQMNGLSNMMSDRRNHHSSSSDWSVANIEVVQVGAAISFLLSSGEFVGGFFM